MARVADPQSCGPDGATEFREVRRSRNWFAGWSFRWPDGGFSWMSPSGWYDECGTTVFGERASAESQLARLAKEPEQFGFGDIMEFY